MVTNNQARAIFGFTGEDSMGKSAFPAIEAAPCLRQVDTISSVIVV